MKLFNKLVVMCLCLGLTAPGVLSAQETPEEMSRKVKELEKLVLELKAEMAAMKTSVSQATSPANETASTQTNQPTPALPKPIEGKILIASLRGPTSLPPAEPSPLPQSLNPASGAPADSKVSLASLLGPTSLNGYVD